MPDERRIAEIEKDIENLYRRTEDMPALKASIEQLTKSVDQMRSENAEQHKSVEAKIAALDTRLWQFIGGGTLIVIGGLLAAAGVR